MTTNLTNYDSKNLADCYGIDVARARNISYVKDVLNDYCKENEPENLKRYESEFFRDIRDIPKFFNEVEEAEIYLSEQLTANKEINPESIRLTYWDGAVMFVPRASWEYNEAEKQLTYEKLCELMDRLSAFLKVDEPDLY